VNPRRLLLAAMLAALCAAFIGTSSYRNFSGLRIRAVKEPVAAGADGVRIPLTTDKLAGLNAPFALIANLRNGEATPVSISIRIDDLDVCGASVPAGQTSRVDCHFNGPWDPAIGHSITLRDGSSTAWSVDALEISSHHGSNASIVRSYVLPAASKQYRPPGVIACVILGLLLTALMLVSPAPMVRPLRIVHRAVVGVFVFWVALVALAPFVSSYRVIVSADNVMWWLVACLLPQLYRLGKPAARGALVWWRAAGPVPRAALAAALTVACFAIVVEQQIAADYDGNRSGPLRLSRERVEAIPWLQDRPDLKAKLYLLDNNGYDGQFMYAIAFDPFLTGFQADPRAYERFIDTPPYRYGRVGYPWLARALSLGDAERLPGAMFVLIYAGVFLAALSVAWMAWRSGGSPWWGLSIALVPGYWMSFRSGLPEPLAAGLAVAGYLCVRESRLIAGALLLAIACLVRETSVFFVISIAGWLAWSKQPRTALALLVMALGPLSLWRLYVGWVFAPTWGAVAFWNPPDDFGPPFAGIAALWSDLSAGRYYPHLWEMRRGIMGLSLLVPIGAALSWLMLRARPGAVTIAGGIFGVMAICFNLKNVWVETGNAERLTTDLFLMLALATPEFVHRSRSWKWTLVAFWLSVAAYLLFGALDASFTRHAFLLD
jgi:hypothetical protein